MKALCYHGVNDLRVDNVSDPSILNAQDAILKVALSSVCGSDLHYIHGLIPSMKPGDVLGHEFVGEIVEVGSAVQRTKPGDRVAVAPNLGCGCCYHCEHDEWSLCDNSNPNGALQEKMTGHATGAFFGCSHLFGGYAGSHAEYIRIPYADHGCFRVPDELSYEQALFTSDALPTGYMAADMAVKPGDVVAIWGAGAIGHAAALSAWLKGASRVIVIDKYDYRLALCSQHARVEILNYETQDAPELLKEMTHGRGPDVCIDAVGMEANSQGLEDLYDKGKQKIRLQNDRPAALRQAIMSCRKGGTLSIVGVYAGLADKFPIGPLVTKALTVKSGLVHGQKYIPQLLEHIRKGELDATYLKTHEWRIEEGAEAYDLFGEHRDRCLRGVFRFSS